MNPLRTFSARFIRVTKTITAPTISPTRELVLVIDIVAGVAIAILGDTVLQDPAINTFGAVMALIGAALYVFFRFLGARQAKRQEESRDRELPHGYSGLLRRLVPAPSGRRYGAGRQSLWRQAL